MGGIGIAHRFTQINLTGSNYNPVHLRGKIYNELVLHLMKYGKRYVPSYFLRGMGVYLKELGWEDMVGVEIGTALGENALAMVKCLSIKKLYTVDPYVDYVDGMDNPVHEDENSKQRAIDFLKPVSDKVEMIFKYGHEAISDVPDDLDFVYIDGCHDEFNVSRDIECWYPKVRSGGVLGGHDFGGGFYGLLVAVLNFVESNNLKPGFGRDGDWWVVKP